MANLKEKYGKEVVPLMMEKFGYKNRFAVPKVEKVVINTGIGKFREEKKALEGIENDLKLITGQKPIYTKARQAISGFKIRKGLEIGLVVTLRGKRMYDFLERFINLALPRARDFRGIERKSFSGRSLNIGIKEQIVFPEISHENIQYIFGLEVSIVTTAKNKEEGLELLKLLGAPIKY